MKVAKHIQVGDIVRQDAPNQIWPFVRVSSVFELPSGSIVLCWTDSDGNKHDRTFLPHDLIATIPNLSEADHDQTS